MGSPIVVEAGSLGDPSRFSLGGVQRSAADSVLRGGFPLGASFLGASRAPLPVEASRRLLFSRGSTRLHGPCTSDLG